MSATRSRRRSRDDRESLSPDPLLLTPSRIAPAATFNSHPHKRQKTAHASTSPPQVVPSSGHIRKKAHWEESDSDDDDVDAEGEDEMSLKSSEVDEVMDGRGFIGGSHPLSDAAGEDGMDDGEEEDEEDEDEEEEEVIAERPAWDSVLDQGGLRSIGGAMGDRLDAISIDEQDLSTARSSLTPLLTTPVAASFRPDPHSPSSPNTPGPPNILSQPSFPPSEPAPSSDHNIEQTLMIDEAGTVVGGTHEPVTAGAEVAHKEDIICEIPGGEAVELMSESLSQEVALEDGPVEAAGGLENPASPLPAEITYLNSQPGPSASAILSDNSSTPPPTATPKQRKPTRVGTAPKTKKGTSVRSQMNALLNARYNSKGEIIESEDEQEKAVEQSMKETGGSIDVDGQVVVNEPSQSDVASAPESPMVFDEMSATPEPFGLPVEGAITTSISESLALPLERIISPPAKKQKKVHAATAATRTSLHMLMNATYNAKGEIIDPASLVEEARPLKKQKKLPEGEISGKGRGRGKGKLVDDARAATPAYPDSVFDAEDSPSIAAEETASLADTAETLAPVPKRRGPGKKNKVSAQVSEAASSEPPGTPTKLNKKSSGKLETGSSGFATPEFTPEKPKKGGKRTSKLAASSPPRSASINSSLPEKEEAPSRRRKQKEDAAVEVEEAAEEPEDETIYCICRKKFREDSSDMVECDLCQNWYHFKCMGMDELKLPLIEQYVCPNCEADPTINERTSWKIKCRRGACNQPDRVPLSKYCSDVCGLHETMARLEMKGISIDHVWETVRSAPRPGGLSIPSASTLDGTASVHQVPQRQGVTFDKWRAELGSAFAAEAQVLDTQRSSLEARISLLEQQEEQLAVAIAAADALPMLTRPTDDAAENGQAARAKPGRKGKPAATPAHVDEKPCGFDVRLIGMPATDHVELCMQGRKRCDRHAGWQKLRAADLELERANLTSDLNRIARRITAARSQYQAVLDGTANEGEAGNMHDNKDNGRRRGRSEESDRDVEAQDIEMD